MQLMKDNYDHENLQNVLNSSNLTETVHRLVVTKDSLDSLGKATTLP